MTQNTKTQLNHVADVLKKMNTELIFTEDEFTNADLLDILKLQIEADNLTRLLDKVKNQINRHDNVRKMLEDAITTVFTNNQIESANISVEDQVRLDELTESMTNLICRM